MAAALAGAHVAIVSGAASAARAYLASTVLARNGFFAAFSLIFLSELGDKTFFIAALLAMRCGRTISFLGACCVRCRAAWAGAGEAQADRVEAGGGASRE